MPKFNPRKGILVIEHLQSFYLSLEILAAEHADVVYRIFPHTFEAKASTWYFGLQANSITNWDTFERLFRSKLSGQRTIASLVK